MSGRGAYGFRVSTAGRPSPLLNDAPEGWPVLEIEQHVVDATVHANRVDRDSAEVGFLTGGGATMTRTPRRAVLEIPQMLTDDELAHPFLAPLASVHAYWLGWLPFHAGAVMINDAAWGIVGERQAGKSSLLAGLAVRSIPVLADDLVVIDGNNVYAGPRTLDLREEAAREFREGRDLGVVGMRERWRLDLPPVPAVTPFGGWIFPRWNEHLSVTRTPAADRLRRLAPGRTVLNPDIDARALMHLAAFPSFDFDRPRSWAALDEGLDVLVRTLTDISAAT